MNPGHPTSDVEHDSDLFVAIIEKLMTQRMLDERFEQQVTPSQLVALRYLSLNESSLMSDVAEGLDISFPAATKTIDRLVRKELATRTEDLRDRRVVRIRLTDQGKELVNNIYRERARLFSAVLERLDTAHGGAAGWLVERGLDEAALARLRTRLTA